MLISVGRYFPEVLTEEIVLCPHEQCVREAKKVRYLVMLGLFHLPIIPVAKVFEWKCSACNQRIEPNQGGHFSKLILLRDSIIALGGFAMMSLFIWGAFTVGGKGSAFDPNQINNVRGFCAFFAFLGFLIFTYALYEARRIIVDLIGVPALTEDKRTSMQRELLSGDTLEIVVAKLAAKGFSDAEIKAFTASWLTAEAKPAIQLSTNANV